MRTLDFRLDIATKDAQKNVDKVNESLEETQQLSEFELILKNADAVSSVKELNEAMEQLQNQALKFGEGSEEFVKAATKAGELKKRMDDVNRSIDTVASGGQLGQITTSFEGLKQSALTFDVEGLARNFALMKTQIAGAATSALGLGQGLNVASIAARGLAVALAATGITVIIAAVAVLVSEFENLADAGGVIGVVFTAVGDAVEFVREKILVLLDDLGLIDLEAKKAADAQKEYFDDLAFEIENNSDLYDEYALNKLKAEQAYYKAMEALRDSDVRDEEERLRRETILFEAYQRQLAKIEKERIENSTKLLNEATKEALEQNLTIAESYQQLMDSRFKSEEIQLRNLTSIIEQENAVYLNKQTERLYMQEINEKEFNENIVAFYQNTNLELLGLTNQYYQDRLQSQKDFEKQQDEIYEAESKILAEKYAQDEIIYEEFSLKQSLLAEEYFQKLMDYDNKTYQIKKELEDLKTKILQAALKDRENLEQASYANWERRMKKQAEKFQDFYTIESLELIEQYNDGIIESEEELQSKLRVRQRDGLKQQLKQQEQHTNELRLHWQTQADLGVISQEKVNEYVRNSLNEEMRLRIELAEKNKQIDDDVLLHKLSNIEKFNVAFIEAQDKINAVTAMVGQTAAQIGDIMTRVSNQRLQELEEQNVAELAALQARLDAGVITEAEAYQQSLQINEAYNRAKYEQEKKAFEQQKAIQIVNAIITGVQSVQSAFASGMAYPFIGPATGAVFAGIAAAFSAAQVALIASEKFPSYGAYSGGAGSTIGSISTPSTTSTTGGGGAGGTSPIVPTSYFSNSGAIIGGEAILNPGGVYQPPGGSNTQVWVLESDITGSQNQVQVTEDRSYFDAGAYGG